METTVPQPLPRLFGDPQPQQPEQIGGATRLDRIKACLPRRASGLGLSDVTGLLWNALQMLPPVQCRQPPPSLKGDKMRTFIMLCIISLQLASALLNTTLSGCPEANRTMLLRGSLERRLQTLTSLQVGPSSSSSSSS
jgi:hypothetical protein